MTIGYIVDQEDGKKIFIGRLGWAIFCASQGYCIDKLIEVDL